jgi:hypothetical protein
MPVEILVSCSFIIRRFVTRIWIDLLILPIGKKSIQCKLSFFMFSQLNLATKLAWFYTPEVKANFCTTH